MLSGIDNFPMALHISLEPLVQYMLTYKVYFFIHLSDNKIKGFITVASQEDPVVDTVLWLLQVHSCRV